jgi:cellulose synthase/poly-beta-1,6-N-acetylglucosamine synthase-like glycosyltransferase
MKVLFWIGIAWLGYVYAGYPLLVWILGKLRPFRPVVDSSFLPSVSVLIAARNEEKDIEWKIRETLAWDYPAERLEVLVASDASTDRTDAILSGIRDSRFRFIRMEQRGGKQVALNRLAELASGEILFFTDANTNIEARALGRMVSYFADGRVGCVTGVEQNPKETNESTLASGGHAFLGYESWLNLMESRVGSVLVCDGSMFALRRSLFTPLQADIANDLESPLRIGAAGCGVLFDPQLRSLERAPSSVRQEFARRRRICGQGLLGMWRLRHCLRGLRGWQFTSRKFLRWLGLVPMAAIATASIALWREPLFAAIALLTVVFLLLAATGLLLYGAGRSGGRMCAFPMFFLLAHTAAVLGLLDTCLGRRYGVWEMAGSCRGTGVSSAAAGGGGAQAGM